MLQHSATISSAAANVLRTVFLSDAIFVPDVASGFAFNTAFSFITAFITLFVAAFIFVVANSYCGKTFKVDQYSGGSRSLYNKFIKQCEMVFNIENNNTNARQVVFEAARLDNTSANVWNSYKLYHLSLNTII